jgi:hypothetical protein
MVEISETTKSNIQFLNMQMKKSTRRTHSAKSSRISTSEMLLKNIKHHEECVRCNANCRVKHEEDVRFWAKLEGTPPFYTYETCPKIVTKNLKLLKRISKRSRGKVK